MNSSFTPPLPDPDPDPGHTFAPIRSLTIRGISEISSVMEHDPGLGQRSLLGRGVLLALDDRAGVAESSSPASRP